MGLCLHLPQLRPSSTGIAALDVPLQLPSAALGHRASPSHHSPWIRREQCVEKLQLAGSAARHGGAQSSAPDARVSVRLKADAANAVHGRATEFGADWTKRSAPFRGGKARCARAKRMPWLACRARRPDTRRTAAPYWPAAKLVSPTPFLPVASSTKCSLVRAATKPILTSCHTK